jgi:hypothetical protein
VSVVPGLLPDPLSAPRSVIDKDSIKDAIERPTEDARTYLCMEKCTWAGDLVVNVFVRAVLLGVDLSVVFRAYVLLPLKAEVCQAEDLPKTTGGLVWSVVRDTPGSLWQRAFVRPWRLTYVWSWNRRLAFTRFRERRRVRRRYRFNYGADTGIRQRVAARRREWDYAYDDEERDVLTLQRRVLNVIDTVVKDHGIDGSFLEQQQTNIYMQVSYKIDKIDKVEGMQVGDHNTMTNTKAAPAGTGPQQPPAHKSAPTSP